MVDLDIVPGNITTESFVTEKPGCELILLFCIEDPGVYLPTSRVRNLNSDTQNQANYRISQMYNAPSGQNKTEIIPWGVE
jgi:hypothetical protein